MLIYALKITDFSNKVVYLKINLNRILRSLPAR